MVGAISFAGQDVSASVMGRWVSSPRIGSRRRLHASVRGRPAAATPCDQKGTREPISTSVIPVREGGLTRSYPASSGSAPRRRDLGRRGRTTWPEPFYALVTRRPLPCRSGSRCRPPTSDVNRRAPMALHHKGVIHRKPLKRHGFGRPVWGQTDADRGSTPMPFHRQPACRPGGPRRARRQDRGGPSWHRYGDPRRSVRTRLLQARRAEDAGSGRRSIPVRSRSAWAKPPVGQETRGPCSIPDDERLTGFLYHIGGGATRRPRRRRRSKANGPLFADPRCRNCPVTPSGVAHGQREFRLITAHVCRSCPRQSDITQAATGQRALLLTCRRPCREL